MKEEYKGLSPWNLTMLALGTVVGGSFFLGSSVAIHAAGPSVIIAYMLGGVLVYFTLFALSEMTVANPAVGSFRTFAAQFFGKGAGYTVGWVYWSGMVLAMSSEATAVSILIQHWIPGISIPLTGSIVIIAVTLLNLLGANKLSKLESGLAIVKLLAIASFIIIGIVLIIGLFSGIPAVGAGELTKEPLMPGGIQSIAGSMLIVMFTYAGFEIIGLAASEADNPQETIPKAIKYTVICLVGFYLMTIAVLLPLIPTAQLSEEVSPMVAALNRWQIPWAGAVINFVLITAILSTMLAAMFGLGRMIRSLAAEGLAPRWLKEEKNVPYRGILFSGFFMFFALEVGLFMPNVYMFLISSGGFALIFTYIVIIATHIRFRKKNGCPGGKCQMPGYPYTSWAVLTSMILILLSMPFIPGQSSGLIAGIGVTVFYAFIYMVMQYSKQPIRKIANKYTLKYMAEMSRELTQIEDKKNKYK